MHSTKDIFLYYFDETRCFFWPARLCIGAVEVGESCRLQVNRLVSCKIDGLECLRTDPSRLGCHSADIGRQCRNQGTDDDDELES